MAHSHSHFHATGSGSATPLGRIAVRVVIGLLAAFAVAVVAGAVMLWPSQQKVDIPLPFQNAAGGAVMTAAGRVLSSEQAAVEAGWQADTGTSYQAWQAQWNQAMEQLVLAYRAMAGTHENNTTSMLARDQAEGAKWGG
jgi:uncharacterized protein YukE